MTFRAVDGAASGAGRTDSNGQYQVTSQWGQGLPEGEYLVAITKFETVSLKEEDAGPYDERAANAEAPPPKSLIPQKYSVPEKSGLKATVNAQSGTIDFDLTD